MSLLENIADSKIKQFGANLGLNCFVPKTEKLNDPIFQLYVVHADKLGAVYYDMWGETLHPQGSRKELETRALEEEAKGHNTYLFQIGGRADGYFNKDFLKDKYQALEVLFHEGFHRRQRHKENKIDNWIEESAAKVAGLEASLSFLKEYGEERDCLAVERNIRTAARYGVQFHAQVNQRVEDLKKGTVIPTIHPFNNAQLLGEYPYYGHFTLCHNVFKRMGTFRGFVELISGLPRELDESKKILKAIQKY